MTWPSMFSFFNSSTLAFYRSLGETQQEQLLGIHLPIHDGLVQRQTATPALHRVDQGAARRGLRRQCAGASGRTAAVHARLRCAQRLKGLFPA